MFLQLVRAHFRRTESWRADRAARTGDVVRSIFTLGIVGPRIFELTFRNYCANKFDGALRQSTSFVQEFA